jgi:hypothetical protein
MDDGKKKMQNPIARTRNGTFGPVDVSATGGTNRIPEPIDAGS